jgi:ubiquinone/menaquinone biosynthesis C-methylase UbiE
MYNPGGRIRADEFSFPYERDSFSFVFLTSVFTHMLAADVQNYLREIRRVLSKSGRCFATFFSIDDEAESLMKSGESTLRLTYQLSDGCFVEKFESQEGAVGYRDADLHKMVSNAGLRVTQCHRGQWPGRKKFLTYQDVYLLEPI